MELIFKKAMNNIKQAKVNLFQFTFALIFRELQFQLCKNMLNTRPH